MKSQVESFSRPPVSLTTRLGPSLPAEAEAEVARFGQHILDRQIAPEREVPYWLKWVRGFLAGTTSAGSSEDALRQYVDRLPKSGLLDWQVAQAERSVRYFLGAWREGTATPAPRVTPAADGTVSDAETIAAMRDLMRLRHYSPRTEQTYVDWTLRYFRYLDEVAGAGTRPRHAVEGSSVRDFLSHLAARHRVAASTQNQAFNALLFLGREVVGAELGDLSKTLRAKRGQRLPVALSPEEVSRLFEHLEGTPRLAAQLIYGGGLLGHASVETTMIYTHVVRSFENQPESPLDKLLGEPR